MTERRRWRLPIRRWVAVVAGIVAVMFVGQALIRESRRRAGIAKEFRALERDVATLEAQRIQLSELLEHANAPEFLEREARLRLGLQKPGESVLIIRPGEGTPIPSASVPDTGTRVRAESNVQRWWRELTR